MLKYEDEQIFVFMLTAIKQPNNCVLCICTLLIFNPLLHSVTLKSQRTLYLYFVDI